jgi:hypothetical protein
MANVRVFMPISSFFNSSCREMARQGFEFPAGPSL